MMDVGSIADGAFFEVLSEYGFSRLRDEPNTFVRAIDDGRCTQHVDVEIHGYMSAFSVVLQEVCADLSRRRQLLGEFEGIDFYHYEPDSRESVDDSISQATGHMAKYGFRWLDREVFDTEPLAEKKKVVAAQQFARLIRQGRSAFKAGNLAEAVKILSAATDIGDLDEVSRKYLELAERRLEMP